MLLKFVLPKGRQFKSIQTLLNDAGIKLAGSERNYRPACNDPDLEIKMLKSQNIPPLLAWGRHDIGFAGKDWIEEQSAEVVSMLDLGFDPVRIVASIPEDWDWEEVKARKLIAVSEYTNISKRYLEKEGIDSTFIRAFGATEVFPPEDADLVIDNTSTGTTLKENRLKIVDTLMTSSTQFIADPRALDDPAKRSKIEDMVLLFESVLEGRKRVLLEMNCDENRLEEVVNALPAMKSPTISKLFRQDGFAVKAAVLKSEVRELLPRLRAAGAADILETPIRKVMP
ncbi:ATP phosphoribosyltransferase [Acanthopleuribacter pedis]|uniref:ATP phosphoribosyltransferase n=1 Tax=Acanthopleuribacter pedis TaxID=442870 RepID=A0A8J7QL34_9BACT|nr:ATP phosphoribosyltransferase [Acanthopleuribacter pedis]MBO1320228.1 ATP phosphoribosyltransferase [Acanthopleuribacter pedis]